MRWRRVERFTGSLDECQMEGELRRRICFENAWGLFEVSLLGWFFVILNVLEQCMLYQQDIFTILNHGVRVALLNERNLFIAQAKKFQLFQTLLFGLFLLL